jgi:predicted nucleic acid-binding Zn ribbon protein
MSESRGGSPQPLGRLVNDLLRSRGLAEGVDRASVFPEWEELVGERIARVATPVGFDRGVLFVEVRSSAWLMELELMERRILARLNADRATGKFERIVFRLASGELREGGAR